MPTAAERNNCSERHPAKLIKVGSAVVQIFGRAPGPYTLAWRESAGGRRHRAMRSSLPKAIQEANDIARDLANGDTAMREFTASDRAAYLRACQLAAPTGKAIEVIAGEYAGLVKSLDGAATPEEAIRWYLEHRPGNSQPLEVPKIVDLLLTDRQSDGVGPKWLRSLESQLGRFATHWTGPLHTLRSSDINSWLKGLGVGPRTRKNYRSALTELATYAQANGYLDKSWNELSQVRAIDVPYSEVRILTPEQLMAILAVAPKSLIPFVAMTAFSGIRHEEMSGPSHTLDWRDVDLDQANIYVPENVGKEGARNVPIPPNLVAWLLPYRKPSGPVCALANASNALARAKHKAKIPTAPNQTRNTLRKSFISYRLGLVKNIGQVAEEAGNSPAVIRRNYKRPVSETEAKRWFSIWPGNEAFVQLPLIDMPVDQPRLEVTPAAAATAGSAVL